MQLAPRPRITGAKLPAGRPGGNACYVFTHDGTRTALTRLLTRPAGKVSVPRLIGAVALGGALLFAGISHLTVARQEFQAQVPPWFPMDKDFVVLASGVVEISLGAALVATA